MSSPKLILISFLIALYLPCAGAATPEQNFLYRVKHEMLLRDADGTLAALASMKSALQSMPAEAGAAQLAPAQ
ncbi:MAG TPA: hypothetical protein VKB27_03570, partial [Gammaproteobacteria bacterium]|nr:hypothetical protein [Gammaproteobacteria bacterium]